MTSYVHGVCTLEISSCVTSDSAMYRCCAVNPLGTDETSCLLHIEGIKMNLNIFKSSLWNVVFLLLHL